VVVGDLAVSTVHVAYLSCTDTDISGWDINELPDMPIYFEHEAIAEALDLSVCLALGVKSEPPLAPPMGRVVKLFLNVCSNPRNFMTPRLTVGWNLNPPL